MFAPGLSSLVIFCAWLLCACARDPSELTPDAALTEFLSAVEGSTHAPALRKTAYEWLDKSSRDALAARAARTASLAGRKLEPYEMIVPGRLGFAGLSRSGVRMQVHLDGERASVEIPIEKRDPVTVNMVREAGRWRVILGLQAQ